MNLITKAPVWLRISGVLVLLSMIMLLLSNELERRSGPVEAVRAEHAEEPKLPSFHELPTLSAQGMQTTQDSRVDMRLELVFLDPGADGRNEACLLDLRDGFGHMGGMARRIPAWRTGRLAVLGPKPSNWTVGQKTMFLAFIEELARRHGLCLADIVIPLGLVADLQPLLGWLRIPATRSRT